MRAIAKMQINIRMKVPANLRAPGVVGERKLKRICFSVFRVFFLKYFESNRRSTCRVFIFYFIPPGISKSQTEFHELSNARSPEPRHTSGHAIWPGARRPRVSGQLGHNPCFHLERKTTRQVPSPAPACGV